MNYDFTGHQHQKKDQFDPYEVFELPRDSDMNTIRQCFRKLTRVYHPDRNRNNPQYNPAHYARICSAYEILSDPRQRAAFDQQHAPRWDTMKDAAKSYPVPAAVDHKTKKTGEGFQTKQSFGEGELRAFNSHFEKNKRANPNDKGYGDQMIGRTTEQDLKRGRAVDAPTNLFGSAKVGGEAFNSRFESELKSKRLRGGPNLMERSDEPAGWAMGGASGAGFSEVSVYDGIIVDKEREDFSKTDADLTGLNYSDYMSGFTTLTEQLPEDHHYLQSDKKSIEKVYNERLSELTAMPDRGHNLTYAQSEAMLSQQQEQRLAREQQRNREVVLKYRDQYASDDLLPPSNYDQAKPKRRERDRFVESQPQAPFRSQNPREERDRFVEPQPQPQAAPFRSQNPREVGNRNEESQRMNNRMLDRQLDPIRKPQPRKF